jgi:hypothetical protein
MLLWEEPPDMPLGRRSHYKGLWLELLAPLLHHPGRWARVKEYTGFNAAYCAAANLRKRVVKRPEGRWEFAAKMVSKEGEPAAFALYARYLGTE